MKTLLAFVLLVAAGSVPAAAETLNRFSVDDLLNPARIPAVLPPGEAIEGALPPGYIVEAVRLTGRKPSTHPVRIGSTYVLDAVDTDGSTVRIVAGVAFGDILAVYPVAGRTAPQVAQPRPPAAKGKVGISAASLRPRHAAPPSPPMPAARPTQGAAAPVPSTPSFSLAAGPAVEVAAVAKERLMTMLVLAAEGSEHPAYQEVAIVAEDAPLTSRIHALSATCIGSLSEGKRAYVLLTYTPRDIDRFGKGDRLQVTAPTCARTGRGDSEFPISILLKQTGLYRTGMGQYLIVGDTLPQNQESLN